MDLVKLEMAVRQLNMLLKDPQPGLATWNLLVQLQCEAIYELMVAAGFDPSKHPVV